MTRRGPRRWALLAGALAVVLTSSVAAALSDTVRGRLDARTGSAGPGSGGSGGSANPLRDSAAGRSPAAYVLPAQPPRSPQAPRTGAWVGAWVRPALPTVQGRLAAVADFEHQLGRPLDVSHVYHQWDDDFPAEDDRALAAAGHTVLLSWAGTDTRQIQAGLYDDVIRARARDLRAWGVPVLLEWRWEMDRPNLQAEVWSPADYVAAWQHLRAVFRQEQVDNVGWVWCPLATGFVDGRAPAFYPGDAEVDWLCADTYPGRTLQPFATAVGPFLDWAAGHPQPVLIGEFGMKKTLGERERQRWLVETGEFVMTRPQIKGLVYFDADRSDSTSDPFDTSLRQAPGSMAALARVAASPWFRTGR